MACLTQTFWNIGLKMAKRNPEQSRLVGYRKFRTFYGVYPEVLAILWNLMPDKPDGSTPKHLLWCMFYLKNYNKEHVNAAFANVDEKTFRLWTWRFIELLSKLKLVKWDNRLKHSEDRNMRVSLDGVDCRIEEPQPFDKKWFSHKFKASGVRYEIEISIVEGEIVWASGGLPCGEWPDLKMAMDLYVHFTEDELTLADKGYRQKEYFNQPSNAAEKKN